MSKNKKFEPGETVYNRVIDHAGEAGEVIRHIGADVYLVRWKVGERCMAEVDLSSKPIKPLPVSLGRKDDNGKPRWGLLPFEAVSQIVDVLMFGAKKYAPDNWRHVPNAKERYFDATMRHLVAWKQGERNDPESGHHHLAHAGCCVLFALALDRDIEDAEHPAWHKCPKCNAERDEARKVRDEKKEG